MGFDRPLNSHKQLLGQCTGRTAQVVQHGRRGKLQDTGKVPVLQVVRRVQAAAGEKGKLDAGRQQVPEPHLQVQRVQFFQKAALHVIGQLRQVVTICFLHGAVGGFHQLFPKVPLLHGAALLRQCVPYGGMVFLLYFPKIRLPRPSHRPCVSIIKQVFQMRSSLSLPDHCNADRLCLDPAVHGAIPQRHVRAGHSIRALGIDQKLVVIGVFIQPGGCGQIVFPVVYVLCHGAGSLIDQLGHIA